MSKKLLSLLIVPLLLAGCATTFTNLTPTTRQVRNTKNTYPLEVAFSSRQETLRWDTIRAFIVVGTHEYPMRRTALMKNRWEGMLPVPAGVSQVQYRYRFDYEYNSLGRPKSDSVVSPEYTLKITAQ